MAGLGYVRRDQSSWERTDNAQIGLPGGHGHPETDIPSPSSWDTSIFREILLFRGSRFFF